MPLNDDPRAIPDDEYNAELEQYAAKHPMPTLNPELYTLDDEEATADGDPR